MRFVYTIMITLLVAAICFSGPAQAAEKPAATTPPLTQCGFTWGLAESYSSKTLHTDKETGTLSLAGKPFSLYLRLNGCREAYVFWQEKHGGFRILATPGQTPLPAEGLIALPASAGTLYLAGATERQPKLEELAAQAARTKGGEQSKAVAGVRDELRRLQRAGSGLSATAPRPVLVAGVSKSMASNAPAGAATVKGERFVARTIRLERH